MHISAYRAWNRESTYKALLLLIAAAVGALVVRQSWVYMGALFGLCLVIVWPVLASLGVFALLVPFDSILVLGHSDGGTTLTFVVGGLAIAVLLATGIGFQRFVMPPKAALWWTLFVFWASASALWAYDQSPVVQRLPTMFSLFILYIVASSYRLQGTEFSGLVTMTILGGFLAALVAFHQFYQGPVVQDTRGSLIVGNRETDPNIFAASLLLPLSLAVGEFLAARALFRRMLMLLAAGAIALGVFVTMSRGALLALTTMVIVYLVKFRMNWRVFVPVVVLGVALLFSPKLLLQRVEKTEATGGAGRVYIWQAGIAAFKDHALVGAGLDNFPLIYDEYAGAARKFVGLHRDPHNIYLQTGVELGVIGLTLLMLAITWQLRLPNLSGIESKRSPTELHVTACQAAAWGMLTASFFLGMLWFKAFWLVWIMLTLACRESMADSATSTLQIASRHSIAEQSQARPVEFP